MRVNKLEPTAAAVAAAVVDDEDAISFGFQ